MSDRVQILTNNRKLFIFVPHYNLKIISSKNIYFERWRIYLGALSEDPVNQWRKELMAEWRSFSQRLLFSNFYEQWCRVEIAGNKHTRKCTKMSTPTQHWCCVSYACGEVLLWGSSVERMHSVVQQPCNFIGTTESVYIRIELLPQDWFGTPTCIWPPSYCFGTPVWSIKRVTSWFWASWKSLA